jgi:hypothetical protein
MSEHLHHKLALIHQSLLHGKLPRNLNWDDVLELIGHLGQVQPHGGDEFAFIVGAKREVFKRPHGHELGIEEVSRLRKFLKEAGSEATSSESVQPSRTVVVIDHHAARVYQDRNGTRWHERDEGPVRPYDPHGFHRHLIHRKEAHYQGERVPEETSFYENVAMTLALAKEIVLVGHGTGKSSAVGALVEYLKTHHPEVSRRVKFIETLDLSAVTDPELEAIVKRHLTR